MSLKEEFLKIKTYEEYDKRRDEFEDLDIRDKEILNHLDDIYPTLENNGIDEDGIMIELYKYPPQKRNSQFE